MQSETAHAAADTTDGFWQLTANDIQGIERALMALRKEYNSAAAALEGRAGIRKTVANLVVYAASEHDAEIANGTLAALAGRHPARTMLIVGGSGRCAEGIDAMVSAACSLDAGQRICYEEIRLHAPGVGGPQLRSIVAPLLISDLPTFLWWTGDPPFRDETFLALVELSDRVIVDSARFQYLEQTLSRLGRFIESDAQAAAIGDLNWGRVAPLRELVTQLFDPPQALALLPHIRRVRIEHAAGGDTAGTAQALLLAGWLASRLDWEPSQMGEQTFAGAARARLRGFGHDVVVELRAARHPHAVPGDVQSVQIEADDGQQTALFSVVRAEDQKHARVRTTFDGSEPSERIARCITPDDAALLGAELDELQPDAPYMEAAAMAGRLATVLPRPKPLSSL